MMQMDYFHEQIASFSSTSQCHALIRIAQRYLSSSVSGTKTRKSSPGNRSNLIPYFPRNPCGCSRP
jgi:hypothetical protein